MDEFAQTILSFLVGISLLVAVVLTGCVIANDQELSKDKLCITNGKSIQYSVLAGYSSPVKECK